MITEHDLYYLRSILRNLREIRKIADGLSLGGVALADNIDWLDCFIDKHQRALHEPNTSSESRDA